MDKCTYQIALATQLLKSISEKGTKCQAVLMSKLLEICENSILTDIFFEVGATPKALVRVISLEYRQNFHCVTESIICRPIKYQTLLQRQAVNLTYFFINSFEAANKR